MDAFCYGTQLFHDNIDHRLLSALMLVSIVSFTVSVLLSFGCECLLSLSSLQLGISFFNVSQALLGTGLVTFILHPPLILYADQSILESTVSSVYMLNV